MHERWWCDKVRASTPSCTSIGLPVSQRHIPALDRSNSSNVNAPPRRHDAIFLRRQQFYLTHRVPSAAKFENIPLSSVRSLLYCNFLNRPEQKERTSHSTCPCHPPVTLFHGPAMCVSITLGMCTRRSLQITFSVSEERSHSISRLCRPSKTPPGRAVRMLDSRSLHGWCHQRCQLWRLHLASIENKRELQAVSQCRSS